MGRRIEDLLLEMRLVSQPELDHAYEVARASGEPLIQVLVRTELVDDGRVARVLSATLNLNRIDLDKRTVDPQALSALPAHIARRLRAIPVGLRKTGEGDFLYLAMSDPSEKLVREVRKRTGREVIPLVAAEGAVERALHRNYEPAALAFEDAEDLPLVVGSVVEAEPVEEDFLTEGTDETVALYGHVGAGSSPPPALPSDFDIDEDEGTEEWLSVATQEVLEIYSPAAHDDSNIGTEDQAWLEQRRHESANYDIPHTVEEEIPHGATVGRLEPAALVCADAHLRAMVHAALKDQVSELFEVEDVAETFPLLVDQKIQHVVVLYPRNDASLVEQLGHLHRLSRPPSVLVISRHRGFDVMGAVSLRIPPPNSVKDLPAVVGAALRDMNPEEG